MKTARFLGYAILALLPLMTGCEDDGYIAAEYVVYDETGDYAAISYDSYRQEYHVAVSVADAWGFPLSYAGVELVVADAPSYSVYGTTDHYGICDFWIEAPPGVVLSVFVDDYVYGSDYFTVVTDPYATDLFIDVSL